MLRSTGPHAGRADDDAVGARREGHLDRHVHPRATRRWSGVAHTGRCSSSSRTCTGGTWTCC
jgi:hypothetical protein